MDWGGWAVFGLVATTGLTAVMIIAQLAGRTRLDLPLMLGTVVTEDPDRARVVGFFVHLAIGQVFALFYAAAFAPLDTASWWLGGLFGLGHAVVALAVIVPLLPGVHPAHGQRTGRPRLRSRCSSRLGCSRSTTARRRRSSPIAAHVAYGIVARLAAAPMNADAASCPSATTGSSATPAAPRWSRPTGASTGAALPRFDDPPLFGRLVGGRSAGCFTLGPVGASTPTAVATGTTRRRW